MGRVMHEVILTWLTIAGLAVVACAVVWCAWGLYNDEDE